MKALSLICGGGRIEKQITRVKLVLNFGETELENTVNLYCLSVYKRKFKNTRIMLKLEGFIFQKIKQVGALFYWRKKTGT